MADHKDMAIPESFHRVKRTLALFCAAMILLEWAIPLTAGDASMKLGLFDLHLPMDVARVALAVSATYYALGLSLEARTAYRINTGMMLGGESEYIVSLKNKSRELNQAALIGQIGSLLQEIAKASDSWLSSNHRYSVSEINYATLIAFQKMRDVGSLDYQYFTEHLESILDNFPPDHASFRDGRIPYKKGLKSLQEALTNNMDAVRNLGELIDKHHRDMTRLHPDIVLSRRIHFFGWEIGGSAVLYAIAMAASAHGLLFK